MNARRVPVQESVFDQFRAAGFVHGAKRLGAGVINVGLPVIGRLGTGAEQRCGRLVLHGLLVVWLTSSKRRADSPAFTP